MPLFSGILQVLDGFASQYQLITIITTIIEVLIKHLFVGDVLIK